MMTDEEGLVLRLGTPPGNLLRHFRRRKDATFWAYRVTNSNFVPLVDGGSLCWGAEVDLSLESITRSCPVPDHTEGCNTLARGQDRIIQISGNIWTEISQKRIDSKEFSLIGELYFNPLISAFCGGPSQVANWNRTHHTSIFAFIIDHQYLPPLLVDICSCYWPISAHIFDQFLSTEFFPYFCQGLRSSG